MEIYDVVKKLVGEIDPIGDSNHDMQRFENLNTMTDLVDTLLVDIADVARFNKNRHEASMKKAGEYAHDFFRIQGIEDY